jgi:hypothetical protein
VLHDGETAVEAQRLGRDRRCDVRVPVPVAADPRGQAEPPSGDGQPRIVLGHRGDELGVHAWQHVPERVLHEVEPGADLVGDLGPCGAGPVREPERGDLGPDGCLGRGALLRQQIVPVEVGQGGGDALELREHAPALGLGRVCGDHELDPQGLQQGRHLVAGDAAPAELGHGLADGLADRPRGQLPGTPPKLLDPVDLFGQVDEIEVEREGGRDRARRVGQERRDLLREVSGRARVPSAARLGQRADPLLDLQQRRRLLGEQHLAQQVPEQMDRVRQRQVPGGARRARPGLVRSAPLVRAFGHSSRRVPVTRRSPRSRRSESARRRLSGRWDQRQGRRARGDTGTCSGLPHGSPTRRVAIMTARWIVLAHANCPPEPEPRQGWRGSAPERGGGGPWRGARSHALRETRS